MDQHADTKGRSSCLWASEELESSRSCRTIFKEHPFGRPELPGNSDSGFGLEAGSVTAGPTAEKDTECKARCTVSCVGKQTTTSLLRAHYFSSYGKTRDERLSQKLARHAQAQAG